MTPPGTPATMTADELAKLMSVSIHTVYRWAAEGEIPCRRVGRRFIFWRERIMAWLSGTGK